MTKFRFSMIVACVLNTGALAQAGAHIEGRVVNSLGKPVSGAEVVFMSLDKIQNGRPIMAHANADGVFASQTLPSGRYRIYPFSLDEGVPNQQDLIFESEGSIFPEIWAPDNQVSQAGTIKLPPRYGSVEFDILDSKTKRSLNIVRCRLTRYNNPRIMYATDTLDSKFFFFLPSRPIAVEITSKGYKPWHYAATDGRSSINLAPGEVVKLTVYLERTEVGH